MSSKDQKPAWFAPHPTMEVDPLDQIRAWSINPLGIDADKLKLYAEPGSEFVAGLAFAEGQPLEGHPVAHLDYCDSQYGPMLWDFALAVLRLMREDPLVSKLLEVQNVPKG